MPKDFLLNLQLKQQGSVKGSSTRETSSHAQIAAACAKWLRVGGSDGPQSGNDCSDFVRSVAKELGVDLHGKANDMFHQIQRPPWRSLGGGMVGAQLAARESRKGSLVVGIWKNPSLGKDGHAAIIVDTDHGSFGAIGLAGQRKHQAIVVVREVDQASPVLLQGLFNPSFEGYHGGLPGGSQGGSKGGSQGSGGSTGGKKHHPIVITRETDSSSPVLWQTCNDDALAVNSLLHFAHI